MNLPVLSNETFEKVRHRSPTFSPPCPAPEPDRPSAIGIGRAVNRVADGLEHEVRHLSMPVVGDRGSPGVGKWRGVGSTRLTLSWVPA
jgi:hypothetical protein